MHSNKPRIFISHAWEDKPLVRRLEAQLQAAGAEVWVDHVGIRGGDNLPERISEALEWCNTLLLIWSDAASQSRWVKLEWTNAISLEKAVIPCQLSIAKLLAILAHKAYVDFRDVDHGITQLLQALNLAQQKTTPAPIGTTENGARIIQNRLTGKTKTIKPKPPQILLRSKPRDELSWADVVNEMLQEKDFFDARWHKLGNGLRHKYEKVERNGHTIVIDHTTGLTWQQNGSLKRYVNIEKYIRELNQQNFGGHKTWRLPTLEEAISLIKPKKNHSDLHIDSVFDQKQKRIWTADKEDEVSAWVVYFYEGTCARTRIDHTLFVRAVSDGQSII